MFICGKASLGVRGIFISGLLDILFSYFAYRKVVVISSAFTIVFAARLSIAPFFTPIHRPFLLGF